MALEILQILASGTFGHVAVVRDSGTGRVLAAKVLRHVHIDNRKVIRRMRDEAALIARLNHPCIVALEELREVSGRPVLLLEWVRGAPLNAVLARCPPGLPPAEVCEVTRQVSEALHAAWNTVDPTTHRPMRVIHRDIKPSNLLLSVDGELKIVDFGIAKGNFWGKESETVSVVLGAEGYVAPERLDGAPDSPAGDVYALGCVTYELLTARRIVLSLHRRHHAERLGRYLMHLRPAGLGPQQVRALTELIVAMAAYDPDERPNHAEVAEHLSDLLRISRWRPDLEGLARQHVAAHLEDRTFHPPELHSAWQDLRFLEVPTGATPAVAPPRESDDRVRAFLAQEGWHLQTTVLRRMLATDPSWTTAPFLERLDQLMAPGPFWRTWRIKRDPRANPQIVAILEFLQARPTDEVRRRVRGLIRHRDPEISAMARQVQTS